MKQTLSFLLVLLLILSGCGKAPESPDSNDTEPEAAVLWEIDPHRGGYVFEDDRIRAMSAVDGAEKYIYYQSEEQIIEFYMSESLFILLNTRNGVTTCYQESHSGDGPDFTNPMVQTLEAFQSLDFTCTGSVSLAGQNYMEHCAVQSGYRKELVKLDYTMYQLEMTWLDGISYVFRYYVYEDGQTLISAEAPNEVNPLLTQNTPWIINTESWFFHNTADGTRVPVTILGESHGRGTSPSGEATEVYYELRTWIYTDPLTGRIEIFCKGTDTAGALVTVLHDPQFQKPRITEDMATMDSDTLNESLFLVSLLEDLFTG